MVIGPHNDPGDWTLFCDSLLKTRIYEGVERGMEDYRAATALEEKIQYS
jgi:hypothetical protein